MEIKHINRFRNKYIKTLRKLNKKIKDNQFELNELVNYVNQIYFINKKMKSLEEDLRMLNNSMRENTTLNLKKKIKKDKKELLDEKRQNESIEAFKPYIFAYYLISQTFDETKS